MMLAIYEAVAIGFSPLANAITGIAEPLKSNALAATVRATPCRANRVMPNNTSRPTAGSDIRPARSRLHETNELGCNLRINGSMAT